MEKKSILMLLWLSSFQTDQSNVYSKTETDLDIYLINIPISFSAEIRKLWSTVDAISVRRPRRAL